MPNGTHKEQPGYQTPIGCSYLWGAGLPPLPAGHWSPELSGLTWRARTGWASAGAINKSTTVTNTRVLLLFFLFIFVVASFHLFFPCMNQIRSVLVSENNKNLSGRFSNSDLNVVDFN